MLKPATSLFSTSPQVSHNTSGVIGGTRVVSLEAPSPSVSSWTETDGRSRCQILTTASHSTIAHAREDGDWRPPVPRLANHSGNNAMREAATAYLFPNLM